MVSFITNVDHKQGLAGSLKRVWYSVFCLWMWQNTIEGISIQSWCMDKCKVQLNENRLREWIMTVHEAFDKLKLFAPLKRWNIPADKTSALWGVTRRLSPSLGWTHGTKWMQKKKCWHRFWSTDDGWTLKVSYIVNQLCLGTEQPRAITRINAGNLLFYTTLNM